ncbi:MAG: PadR family transcriptional regulator [Clostridia bacterium]|nr:PadR family transcriptional regulator [Clostridia bacterium]
MAESIALTEAVYFILLTLTKPLHGYGIMQLTEQLSAGRVRLAAGTLYGALNTLCDKCWIRELPVQAGSRKKEYVITDAGREVLQNELTRLKQLVTAGEEMLK